MIATMHMAAPKLMTDKEADQLVTLPEISEGADGLNEKPGKDEGPVTKTIGFTDMAVTGKDAVEKIGEGTEVGEHVAKFDETIGLEVLEKFAAGAVAGHKL